MEARYMTDLEYRICHAVNIYLYRNGKDGETPILVHIPPAKKKNMRAVMNVIQERVQFPVGFSAYLYKMDGKRVRHPCELEMYNNYVVASNYDKYFKCAQYGRKRSPLLVLNRESKHIRVLRQHNQNYYEWSLKKKAVGEERPQFIYPTFYTNENARAQDLPVGQMGNFVPPGAILPPGCCITGERFGDGGQQEQQQQQRQQSQQQYGGGQSQQQGGGQQQQYGQQQQGYPSGPGGNNASRVYPCLIMQTDKSAKEALKKMYQQERPTQIFTEDGLIMTEKNGSWSSSKYAHHRSKKEQGKSNKHLRESDILNANTILTTDDDDDDEDCKVKIEDYTSDVSVESLLDTDCLGEKYQDLLKQYKRKLKKQALQELQSSLSSVRLGRSRHRVKPRRGLKPVRANMGILTRSSCVGLDTCEEDDDDEDDENNNDDEQIIVLPPPPVEFRDGIIARRGTFYSFTHQQE